MLLVDVFDQPGVVDRYTFVFDGVTAETGYNTMLAMSEDGHTFSQLTTGFYDLNGFYEHLGQRIPLAGLGAVALDGFFRRMCIPKQWEEVYQTIEHILREDGDG